MDLPLYMRVLWRFRRMVFTGLALAFVLAFLSYFRVDISHGRPQITYRGVQTWGSYAKVFVTRRGFEWGSAILGSIGGDAGTAATRINAQVSEEGRLSTLASLYASFAMSDPVQEIMLHDGHGKIAGKIDAAPLPATESDPYALLPLISIVGMADTPDASRLLASRASSALAKYIEYEQKSNNVPPDQRIQLTILNRAGETKLLVGRPKSMPVIVLMLVLMATVGVAFLRENLNPAAPRRLAAADDVVAGSVPGRRTA